MIPSKPLIVEKFSIPTDIILTDPNFSISEESHISFGPEYFFELLKTGQIRCETENLLFNEIIFGYIISGTVSNSSSHYPYCRHSTDILLK